MNQTIANLETISRDGEAFTVIYRWTEQVTVTKSLPVYTNVPNMTGKIYTSRTLRHLYQSTQTVKQSEAVSIDKETARLILNATKVVGTFERIEYRPGENRWVARMK